MRNFKVSNILNANGNYSPNQYLIRTPKGMYFQSYDSVVCKYDGKNVIVSNYWDYSKTTLKHLYIFLRGIGYSDLCKTTKMRKAIKDGNVILKNVNSLDII
jgi:hypothetical protein